MIKYSKIWIFALLLSMFTAFGILAEEAEQPTGTVIEEAVIEAVAESGSEDTAETVTEENSEPAVEPEKKTVVYGRVEDALVQLRDQSAEMDEVQLNSAESEFAREFLSVLSSEINISGDSETITRGDFVKTLVTLVSPGTKYSGGSSFDDIAPDSEYAGYVDFALQTGIVSPAAEFNPDRTVTYAEAYKMAVCAIGYGVKAGASGGWPTGYLSLAHQLRISKNIIGKANDTLLCGDAAIILYRTVTANMMFQAKFGERITYKVYDGKSIITEYYDIHEVEGILDANVNTSLISADGASVKGSVTIDGTMYFCDDDEGLLGCNVLAYYKGGDEINTLVLLKREDTEIKEMFAEYVTVKGNEIEYNDGVTEEEYELAPTYNYIYNGKAKLMTSSNLADYLEINGALLRLVDADKDERYETVFVDDFKYIRVASVDFYGEIIYDKITKDNMLDLSDNDCKYEFYKLVDGTWTEATWDDITTDTVLAAAVSEDDMYAKIYICEDTVTGTISAAAFDQSEIYIDDVLYGLHPYFTENYQKKDVSGNTYYSVTMGNEYVFMIGIDGRIVLCNMDAAGSTYMYGWIVKLADVDSIGTDVQIKMFTQNGKMLVYTLAKSVLVDGEGKTLSQTKAFLEGRGNNADTYLERFVRYTVNQDNQITRIDTSVDASNNSIDYLDKANRDPDNQLMKYTFTNTLNYRSNADMFGMQFNISKAVCFMIPPYGSEDVAKDESYSLMSSGYYKNNDETNNTTKLIVYDIDLSGSAGAMVNLQAGTILSGDSIELDTRQAVVEKVAKVISDDDTIYYKVQAWTAGGYDAYYFKTDEEYDVKPQDLNPGDIIRVTINYENVVAAVAYDFNFEKFEISSSLQVANRNSLYVTRYLLGIPYNTQDGYVNIFGGSYIDGKYVLNENYNIENMYNLNSAPVTVINAKRSASTGEVISASVSNEPKAVMREYKTTGENADVVLTHLRYLEASRYYAYRITYVD